MKAAKWIAVMAVLVLAPMLVSCKSVQSAGVCEAEAGSALYVCDCGSGCCSVVQTTPGKCGCGHDLKAGHVHKIEGTVAVLCMCKPDCECGIDENDSTKCGCGHDLRRVDLKGSGLYACGCGGGCCTIVSSAPGKCGCGHDLQKL
ncbi:MAG: hypothetical protein RI897_1137 [Verrucomicrobiota bacterium]